MRTTSAARTEIRLEERAGVPVIRVRGAGILPPEAEIISQTYRQWRKDLDPARARRTRTAIVDLAGVPRCGSWIFTAIISVYREIEDRLGPGKAQVLLAGLQEEPKNVYRYMSLDRVMECFPDVDHALEWLRQHQPAAGRPLR